MDVTFTLVSADPSSNWDYSQDSTNIYERKDWGMKKGKNISAYL